MAKEDKRTLKSEKNSNGNNKKRGLTAEDDRQPAERNKKEKKKNQKEKAKKARQKPPFETQHRQRHAIG